MRSKNKKILTAADLCDRIAAKHSPPEWACFFNVANALGGLARRRADGIAMNLWPSRGLMIRGFEVKISRSDLRREAANPEKAEEIARYCDEWWLVTPKGLVSNVDLEVPPAWGLLEAWGRGLHVVRAAIPTEAELLTRGFLAAILRQAQGMVASANDGWIRKESLQDKFDEYYELGEKKAKDQQDLLKNREATLQFNLKYLREKTGIDFGSSWDAERAALQLKVGQIFITRYGGSLEQVQQLFRNAAEKTQEILTSLDELIGTCKEAR